MVDPIAFTDEVARSLKRVMPDGFGRQRRKWTRTRDGLTSAVAVERNPASFNGLGELVEVTATVQLESGLGTGYWRAFGQQRGPTGWWLWDPSNITERDRIVASVSDAVTTTALPWIEERATRRGYLDNLHGRSPTTRIEGHLAFGNDAELADLLAEGPMHAPSADSQSRRLCVEHAEAALRAYRSLGVYPPEVWMDHAKAILKAYRGRPPKSDRELFERLKSLVSHFSEKS
ncbi:MAG: hypothetical protein AB7N61_19645 [Acidimicrobiia bacterium]